MIAGCQRNDVPETPLHSRDTPSSALPPDSANVVQSALPNPPEGFVYFGNWRGISLDLRYRTPNNFVHENLYGEYLGAYLHKDAAEKLQRALQLLQQEHPGWKLRIFDALRPRDVHRRMWEYAKTCGVTKYVANPNFGSGHNFGMSVDLTLEDSTGSPLDMGTPFDTFSPIAQPRFEARYLRSGMLTAQQVANRIYLRRIMKEAGFHSLLQEWWHFNAQGMKTIKARYTIIEHSF